MERPAILRTAFGLVAEQVGEELDRRERGEDPDGSFDPFFDAVLDFADARTIDRVETGEVVVAAGPCLDRFIALARHVTGLLGQGMGETEAEAIEAAKADLSKKLRPVAAGLRLVRRKS